MPLISTVALGCGKITSSVNGPEDSYEFRSTKAALNTGLYFESTYRLHLSFCLKTGFHSLTGSPLPFISSVLHQSCLLFLFLVQHDFAQLSSAAKIKWTLLISLC